MTDEASRSHELSYNEPLDLFPEHHACAETYDGSVSQLRIVNLSTGNRAEFWVIAGDYHHLGELNANDPTAFVEIRNFGGKKLQVTNLSSPPATLRVMLLGA